MKLDWLELNVKRVLIIIGSWVAAVILHNLISALFKAEEGVFFIIAIFIIPIYFIFSLGYTIYKQIRGKK